jgi:hypothetical protein
VGFEVLELGVVCGVTLSIEASRASMSFRSQFRSCSQRRQVHVGQADLDLAAGICRHPRSSRSGSHRRLRRVQVLKGVGEVAERCMLAVFLNAAILSSVPWLLRSALQREAERMHRAFQPLEQVDVISACRLCSRSAWRSLPPPLATWVSYSLRTSPTGWAGCS